MTGNVRVNVRKYNYSTENSLAYPFSNLRRYRTRTHMFVIKPICIGQHISYITHHTCEIGRLLSLAFVFTPTVVICIQTTKSQPLASG